MSKGYVAKTVNHTGSFNSGTALGNNSYKKCHTPVNLKKKKKPSLFFGVNVKNKMTLNLRIKLGIKKVSAYER